MNISKLNLNLLIALDALLTEQSVTAAANKCFVTQAAMSNTLKQLRSVFNDPLFIRESKSLQATPFALELKPRVKRALLAIEHVFKEPEFDPLKSERIIHLWLSEHGEHLVLPSLQKYLSQHAPNMKLIAKVYDGIESISKNSGEEIHLAIATESETNTHSNISMTTLFHDSGVCVMNQQHPLASKKLTLQRYTESSHIIVNYNVNTQTSYVQEILGKLQITRNAQITVPRIFTAMQLLLEDKQLIGTFPKKLLQKINCSNKLVIKKPPFEIPSYPLHLMWHSRISHDLAAQWLIQRIAKICQFKT